MNRYQVSKRTRYSMFLDRDEHIKTVEKYLFPRARWNKLDRLDRAVTAKVTHWLEYYVTRFNSLPKNMDALKAQFALIVNLSTIEAAIGMPKGAHTQQRIYDFFHYNLDLNDQNKLTHSLELSSNKGALLKSSLQQTVRQLILRRHGLLHRAELITLPTGDILFVGTRGHNRAGRKSYFVTLKLKPEMLTELTTKALRNYFQTKLINRKPQQDYSLKGRKRGRKSI